jgi:hypothetical protein
MATSKQASAKAPDASKTTPRKRRAPSAVKKKREEPKILTKPLGTLTLNNLVQVGILTVEGSKGPDGSDFLHVNLSERDLDRIAKAVVAKIPKPTK